MDIDTIKATAEKIVPQGARVILYGSRARGDSHAGSDWDVLIVLDKPKVEESDRDLYSYPLWELGWQQGAMIHPIVYSAEDWQSQKGSAFYDNVERDGVRIC